MEKVFVTLWILFGIYIMVLFAILADLWSGVRKAKKNGIARSSYGYKRMVDKIARYYNVMLALTVIDVMQMASIWYLETYYEFKFPMFPFITLLGAMGIGMIEIKSIYEKAADKETIEIGEQLSRFENKDDITKNNAEFFNLVDKVSERKQQNEINRAASLLIKFGDVRYQKMQDEQNLHKKQSFPKIILPYYKQAIELNSQIDLTETRKRIKELE